MIRARLKDFRKDPKAFIWYYATWLRCFILGHQESDLYGIALRPVCLRCGDDKVDGKWRGRS